MDCELIPWMNLILISQCTPDVQNYMNGSLWKCSVTYYIIHCC